MGHVGAQRCAPTLLCLLSDQPILVLDLPSPLRAARFRLTLSIRALSIRLLLPITILLLLWPAHVRLQMSERSPTPQPPGVVPLELVRFSESPFPLSPRERGSGREDYARAAAALAGREFE